MECYIWLRNLFHAEVDMEQMPLIPKSDCELIYEDMLQEVRKRG